MLTYTSHYPLLFDPELMIPAEECRLFPPRRTLQTRPHSGIRHRKGGSHVGEVDRQPAHSPRDDVWLNSSNEKWSSCRSLRSRENSSLIAPFLFRTVMSVAEQSVMSSLAILLGTSAHLPARRKESSLLHTHCRMRSRETKEKRWAPLCK